MSCESKTNHRLVIKSVVGLAAGLGEDGKRFGELVSTSEIVENMRPALCGKDGTVFPVDPSWIEERLGFKTVSFSNDTINLCRAFWNPEYPQNAETAFRSSRAEENDSLYEMLAHAVQTVVEQVLGGVEERSEAGSGKSDRGRILAHIHLAGHLVQNLEEILYPIRVSTGAAPSTLTTLVIQQGCAGILPALELADSLLTAAEDTDGAYVLITAESNMLPYAHQRARALANTRTDLDRWLFPIIFGEAVGAMMVGVTSDGTTEDPEWAVEDIEYETLADDWRVTLDNKNGYTEVLIRARAVPTTYLRGVPKHARLAIEKLGGRDRIHRLILHESNPGLITESAMKLEFPLARIPSVCAETGTLASVSSFMLLELAFRDYLNGAERDHSRQEGQRRDSIACSLIGEAGNHIIAGHLTLRRTSCVSDGSRNL